MAVQIPDFKIKTGLNVAGEATFKDDSTFNKDLYVLDDLHVTDSIGVSGSMVVGDDLTIIDDLNIGGGIIVQGDMLVEGQTTTIESSVIKVVDPLLTLGLGNTASDVHDMGWFSSYYDTSLSSIRYTGLYRDATDKHYKIFHSLSADPSTYNITDSDSTFAIGNLCASLLGEADRAIKLTDPITIQTDTTEISGVGSIQVGGTTRSLSLGIKPSSIDKSKVVQNAITINKGIVQAKTSFYP